MDEQRQEELYSKVRVGEGFERFLSTDIGQHMADKIDEEERDAEVEYRGLDAADTNAIRNNQNRLKVCDLIRKFIHDAIEDKKAAIIEIQNDEMFDED